MQETVSKLGSSMLPVEHLQHALGQASIKRPSRLCLEPCCYVRHACCYVRHACKAAYFARSIMLCLLAPQMSRETVVCINGVQILNHVEPRIMHRRW